MTKSEYVKSAEEKNKAIFAAEKVAMTPKAIRQMIEHAFDAGEKQGRNAQKAAGKVESLFSAIYGK